MPKVSMTTFIDFVIARGATRITRVRNAKKQYSQDYSPARDFYRQLRQAILDIHYDQQPLALLDQTVEQANSRKQDLYQQCVGGYKRWHRKKTFTAFPIENEVWSQGELEVNVNPELELSFNGTRHLVKLYFKKDSPTKQQIQAALYLLAQHSACAIRHAVPAILDVQESKLHTQGHQVAGISALLAGDAVAFETMWNQL